jgi:hypothetical protein
MARTSTPKTRAYTNIIRLKVTLRGVKPPVWRRLLMPGTRLWCKYSASTDTSCCAVPISSNQYRVPDSRHGLALKAQTRKCELALADSVHQLDAGDRDRSVRKPLEADHHSDALLHAPMVLLNQIVQVFRRS